MAKIGFIGRGIMGLPMAARLLEAGHQLTVYNRTQSKAQELVVKGAKTARSPAEATAGADVVWTMLTADAAVEDVILGPAGVMEQAREGLIVVDSSTVSPTTSRKVAHELASRGTRFLDAPVTGSEPQAQSGALTFMVGGDEGAYKQCGPFFGAMGKSAVYMGQSGAGAQTKLANNAMAAINLLGFVESLTLASKAGIDPERFLQVVSGGGARSAMAENKLNKILSRDFSPQFLLHLMLKDLRLASDLAREMEVSAPVLAQVRELFQMAKQTGHGEDDISAMVKCYEAWSQTTVNRKAD